MEPSSDIIYRYSPELVREDVLRKTFVGREKLLESLVKEIEDSAKKKTPRFYLIIGPRGIGKSHFLMLLYYEIERELSSLLVPIKLAEEEYSVYRASDLFLRILEERSEDISEILSLRDEDEILDASLERLKEMSKKEKKMFVVFMENLHELFRQFDLMELQKLRSRFQECDIFSIVATAPMIFPGITDHEQPFYDFFRTQHLQEFSLDEINLLFKKVAEVENNKEFLDNFKKYEPKIHGMAHLTGGSPRLVILFYEIITKGEIENIEKAFFKIIDEHTPYYQEIFQLLTGQKRRIFDIIISHPKPITPKEISEIARIEMKTVVMQLRRLEKDGYVRSRRERKNTYYEVRERLFRLWRDMRQPFGRKRLSILLEFMQHWYTPEERKELFETRFKLLEEGEKNVIKELCYYAEIQPVEFKTEALLKLTPKLIDHGEFEDAEYEIQKLKETSVKTSDKIHFYEARLLHSKGKYEDALEALNKALKINPKNDYFLSMKGDMLMRICRFEDALKSYKKALDLDPENDYLLSMKGYALGNLGRPEEALEAFDKSLKLNPEDDFALSRKGLALKELGKYDEALEALNKSLELNPNDEFSLVHKFEVLLLYSDKHSEILDTAKRLKEITTKESLKIFASIILAFTYVSLNKKTNAISEIEEIKDRIFDQEPLLIELFVEVCLISSFAEFRDRNNGNAIRLMKMAYNSNFRLDDDTVLSLTIEALKDAADSAELPILKTAVDEIIKLKGEDYQERLKPIIKAIEIIESKDIHKYYELQIEEREIVADIVKTITKSDELIPDDIKRKKSR